MNGRGTVRGGGGRGDFGCTHKLEAGSAAEALDTSEEEALSRDKANGVPSLFRRSDNLPHYGLPLMPYQRFHEYGRIDDACLLLPPPPCIMKREILEFRRAVVNPYYYIFTLYIMLGGGGRKEVMTDD